MIETVPLSSLTSAQLLAYLEKVTVEQLISDRREELKQYVIDTETRTGGVTTPTVMVLCTDGLNVNTNVRVEDLR